MNPANLNPKFTVPTVASDGNFITINEADIPSLHFVQVRGQDGNVIDADVVASVRLANIAELEGLVKVITETIDKHKNRER